MLTPRPDEYDDGAYKHEALLARVHSDVELHRTASLTWPTNGCTVQSVAIHHIGPPVNGAAIGGGGRRSGQTLGRTALREPHNALPSQKR